MCQLLKIWFWKVNAISRPEFYMSRSALLQFVTYLLNVQLFEMLLHGNHRSFFFCCEDYCLPTLTWQTTFRPGCLMFPLIQLPVATTSSSIKKHNRRKRESTFHLHLYAVVLQELDIAKIACKNYVYSNL